MAAENLSYQFTAETQQFVSGIDGMLGKLRNVVTGSDAAAAGLTAFGKAANDAGGQMGFFEGRVNDVESSVQSLGKVARAILLPFSTLFGGAVVGVTGFVIATARAEEALRKLSQAGLSSRRSLREFGIIASGSSVDMKDISGWVDKAHDSIRNISKPTDESAVSLKFLGLNLKELKAETPEEQFRSIAEAILGLNDPATQAALAQELLGTSIEKLREITDDSGKKVKELSDAQKELVTTQEANAAGFEALNTSVRAFQDAMADAAAGVGSLVGKIAGELLPIFDWVVQKATAAARAVANMFASANAGFADFMKSGSKMIPGASSGVTSNPSDDLPGVAPDTSPRKMEKPATKQVESAKEVAKATSFVTAELTKQLPAVEAVAASQAKAAAARVKAGDAEAARLKSMKKAAEDAEKGGGGGKSKGGGGKSDEEKELDKLKKEAEALNDLYLPMEKLNKQTEKFNELFNKGLISAGVRDQAIAKATEDAEKRMKELNKSTDMAGKFMDDLKDKAKSFSDTLIDGIVDGKKSFSEMISGIMKDIAKLALKSAINPMMEGLTSGKGKMGGMLGGSAKSPLPGAQGPSLSMLGGIGKRAVGGRADGLTLVGERGPELAMFGSGGGYVANASDTQRMMGSTSAGTNISNITVNVPQGTTPDQGAKIAKFMDQALEARIRKSQVDQRRAQPLRG